MPLKKGENGLEVRPILIGEALVSLPGAWLKHITASKTQKIFKNTQFGLGVPAGAEVMITLCQTLIKLDPEDALYVLDMINGFGEISRAEIIEEAILVMPEIVPFLLQLWGESATSIYTPSGTKQWTIIEMYDGLFQGNNLSTIGFCLGLRRAMRRFTEVAVQTLGPTLRLLHLEYIDDLVVKFHPDQSAVLLPLLESALLSVNLKLNYTKCKVFIPSAIENDVCEDIQTLGIKQVYKSIDLLGGAVEGEFCAMVGDNTTSTPPSASSKRLEEATKLKHLISKLLQKSLTKPSCRSARTLIRFLFGMMAQLLTKILVLYLRLIAYVGGKLAVCMVAC